MKKLLFGLIAILISSGIAFGQNAVPGTVPEGENSERGVNANGLTPYFSATGNFTLSADGAGSLSAYSVDVDKPNAGATVHKAFLLLAPKWGNSTSGLLLAGAPITWDASSPNASGGTNYISDVTTIVTPIIDPASPGITSIAVTESSTSQQDGVALLVIFNDPLAGSKTIVIMFGGLSTTGDNFSLTLGTPINPADPGALLDMGLGISYGFQPSGQVSLVDINGARLTSSAGGQDDGESANGALITVGGIGDLNTNPAPYDPDISMRTDDELYSLLPFITSSTTNILVATSNPTNDDNIFLSYFEISGAAIIGEGILLTQTTNVENLGDNHTVKALVQDNNGNPVVGTMVDFEILSGPNAGNTFSVATDASGCAFYTYQGTGGPGVDVTEACFVNSQGATQCSNHLSVNWGGSVSVPVSNWAILLGIFLIAAFTVVRYRRRIA